MKMITQEAQVEWKWQEKTENLGEEPVPMPLCPPQISHGLNRDRTRDSAVRGQRLTAWAIAQPRYYSFLWTIFWLAQFYPCNELGEDIVCDTLPS
jgi:hypothetical protein